MCPQLRSRKRCNNVCYLISLLNEKVKIILTVESVIQNYTQELVLFICGTSKLFEKYFIQIFSARRGRPRRLLKMTYLDLRERSSPRKPRYL